MAVVDDPITSVYVDEAYEFSAPRFFDFVNGETEEDKRKAELWFKTALSYAPSPSMRRIKSSRSFKVETLCDFSEAEEMQNSGLSDPKAGENMEPKTHPELMSTESLGEIPAVSTQGQTQCMVKVFTEKGTSEDDNKMEGTCSPQDGRGSSSGRSKSTIQVGSEVCTPKPVTNSQKGGGLQTNSKNHQTAQKIASLIKNPSTLKPKGWPQSSQSKGGKTSSIKKRDAVVKNSARATNLAQENQASKRQKLEGGKSRQILSVKAPNLPHKSKMGLIRGIPNLCFSTAYKTNIEDRKMYVREPAAPFVPMAEMMKKFQSSTRDISLPHLNNSLSHDGIASVIQMKPKLTLTRPKEPEFETSQRVRPTRIKSSDELEEETMAKIPKFKARPMNKKILEAPTLPPVPRSTPQPPEFQEFNFETMARANHNVKSASVASTELSRRTNNDQWKPQLTEPKTPLLHTLLRARPPRVKSSFELEQEELEKIPKFKARPLNKKIFESKGGMGIFSSTKKKVTVPQEFHFATNERIPPPASAVFDLFDKLSISSEPHNGNKLPRNTKPNPFHLHTEERGAEKERRFFMELMQKQIEEERARIPRAHPYPYTTDYPVLPPKPEPKQCTKPEPFELESLVRHEEEMQREMEERLRMEKEEAERRAFKAQPKLKEDPIPVPEKARIPLTQIQGFNLHVDHRAVDRAEFDQKIKERELSHKRYREESEAARLIEEGQALKQLRRTMVPHARPMPRFDHPFCPEKSSKEMTKAKSPKLRVLQRKERQRMVKTAISSAAANMR